MKGCAVGEIVFEWSLRSEEFRLLGAGGQTLPLLVPLLSTVPARHQVRITSGKSGHCGFQFVRRLAARTQAHAGPCLCTTRCEREREMGERWGERWVERWVER